MEELLAKFTDASTYQYLAAAVALVWLVGVTGMRRGRSRLADASLQKMAMWFAVAMITVALIYGYLSGAFEPARSGEVPASAQKHTLKRIIDGDTVELTDGTRIRLHGIDTPERDQPYGKQATRQLDGLLGRTVYVEKKDIDRYGRVVAVLWSADGTNVNAAMVCGGHAWWYERYARFDSELRDCQSEAQKAMLGLWAKEGAVAPWDWRKR
ncbi:thermonuclease family protein [Luminiphilus sp.]|nr:thermonuclease family protein [Luminiphilus sp.]